MMRTSSVTHVDDDEAKLRAISYSSLSVFKTFTHHTVVMKGETVHTVGINVGIKKL